MKPHLLLVLLLALPPLLCNILACDNAEAPETSPAAKSFTAPKENITPAVAPSVAPVQKSAPKPAKSGGGSSHLMAWFMM